MTRHDVVQFCTHLVTMWLSFGFGTWALLPRGRKSFLKLAFTLITWPAIVWFFFRLMAEDRTRRTAPEGPWNRKGSR